MREIKFRGKTANGEWFYGSLAYSDNIEPAIYFEFGKGTVKTFDFVYVKPETVGQFTGLLDKRGRKIFEGDIIRTDGIDGVLNWECYCDEETYDFRFYPIGHEYCPTHNGAFDEDEREVIGNIHDNKMEDIK